MLGRDLSLIAGIGRRGTLPWSLDGIFDQANATCVIIRVPRAPSPKTSVLLSFLNTKETITEPVTRGVTDLDELAHDAIATINSVSMGGTVEYVRNIDWERDGSSIKWLKHNHSETIARRRSTVDPLEYQSDILSVTKIWDHGRIYAIGTDYQIHAGTGGIEWLANGTKPAEQSEYYIEYVYSHRPLTGAIYECQYSYYSHNLAEGEVVTRSSTDKDYLENVNILNVRSVQAGDQIYVETTDWELLDNTIHWITHNDVESVTRTAGNDELLHSAHVLTVGSVYQGTNIFTKNVDWTVTLDGKINFISVNKPGFGEVYNVSYSWGHRPADGTQYEATYTYKTGEVTAISSVVGGVNIDTGFYEGVHALMAAEGEVFLKPKILIAPGFTQYVPVTAEMLGIADELLAVIVADGPNTNNQDAIRFRREFGDKRVYVIDPWVKFWNTDIDGYDQQPSSARVAGVINKVDNRSDGIKRGWWTSPSNELINGITGIARPIPKTGGENSVANYLNSNEVAVICGAEDGGYHLWGNRTCSSDPLYWFINSVRTDDMIQESLTQAMRWAIDLNITTAFFEEVTARVNSFCRNLENIGAIKLGKNQNPCWVDPNLNTPDQMMLGKAVINFDYDRFYPCEHLTIQRYINHDYLKTIVEGQNFLRSA
jgi:phage tail sheath protein FI